MKTFIVTLTDLNFLAKRWLDAYADPDSATECGEIELEIEEALIARGWMDEDDAIESIDPAVINTIIPARHSQAITITFEAGPTPLTIPVA